MQFKTDENLPDEFAEVLRTAGWDAVSVVAQQLGGKADPEIASACLIIARFGDLGSRLQ